MGVCLARAELGAPFPARMKMFVYFLLKVIWLLMQYPGVLVIDLTSPVNMNTPVDGVESIDVLFGV
jgi:hypothetical protein